MRWSRATRWRAVVLVAVSTTAIALATVAVSTPAGAKEARPPHHASALLHQLNASRISGNARFSWRVRHRELVARVRLKHLARRSRHAVQVESGSCVSGEHDLVFRLRDVVTNEFGGGHTTTRLRGIDSVDFRGGWHVAVYNQVNGEPQLDEPLACGDIRATT